MSAKKIIRALTGAVVMAAVAFLPRNVLSQADGSRGLWAGSVTLNAVNEVAVGLDADNVPIAPDPNVPTPAFDQASLRLLLHVNGAGQVFLLKDVAILNRSVEEGEGEPSGGNAREGDLALVSDPRLYAEFPPQPAFRMAAAAFDFGDARTTQALDAIVKQAARAATDFVMDPGLELDTQGQRVQARDDAVAAMTPALSETAVNADVAAAFDQFLNEFDMSVLDAIAADPECPEVADFTSRAEALRDGSFYGDTRALDMVQAVVETVTEARNAPSFELAEVERAARNTASSFADVENLYQRFIAGKIFSDMMYAAAYAAPDPAKQPGADANEVADALRELPEWTAAMSEALRIKVQRYDDTRGQAAMDHVLAKIAETAVAHSALSEDNLRRLCEGAARDALAGGVERYPLPLWAPTLDYNAFVKSATFADSVSLAAPAAAEEAIAARANDPLYTESSVYAAALVGAVDALRTQYSEAARAMRTELPLEGTFGPGAGDPRFVRDLAQPGDLGAAGIEGRIILPANHPTNPFRHRRHPNHTAGFRVERRIRLDFDGVAGDALEPAGYGTDRISGTYREEIFGLHKPLGPDPENAPIGLKVEGRFELNRISTIDTLNTR